MFTSHDPYHSFADYVKTMLSHHCQSICVAASISSTLCGISMAGGVTTITHNKDIQDFVGGFGSGMATICALVACNVCQRAPDPDIQWLIDSNAFINSYEEEKGRDFSGPKSESIETHSGMDDGCAERPISGSGGSLNTIPCGCRQGWGEGVEDGSECSRLSSYNTDPV